MKNLKLKIIIAIIVAAIIYLAFSLYVNIDKLIEAFSLFNWMWLPLILFLSYLNYHIRFERWHYYLKILNIEIPRNYSFIIFFAGMVMSITPGKFGEVLKSYLMKEYKGFSIHSTAPIILVERLVDFIALLIVAMIGALIFHIGTKIVLITLIFFLAILVLLSWQSLAVKIVQSLEKISFFRKISHKILTAYNNSYALLKPFPLFSMLLVTIVAWGFEGLGLYIILYVFDTPATFFWSIFIYSFSTIVGAITLLPGGVGGTEGSLTFLLTRTNIPLNIAFVSTFLIRVCTLWFAIVLGIIGLVYFQKIVLKKKTFEIEENK